MLADAAVAARARAPGALRAHATHTRHQREKRPERQEHERDEPLDGKDIGAPDEEGPCRARERAESARLKGLHGWNERWGEPLIGDRGLEAERRLPPALQRLEIRAEYREGIEV